MAPAREIRASRLVEAPQNELFDFLENLDNHWRLADDFIDVLALERDADGRADGGRVRMRGPMGVSRQAATKVLAADAPHQMLGMAEVGPRTRGFVRWKLHGDGGGTRVRLEATIDRVGWLDRVLLVLGGRAWLERRFDAVLGRLPERFAARATAVEGRQSQSGGRKS
jgi:uncharacterized protein YndB with AHSA1/START domain